MPNWIRRVEDALQRAEERDARPVPNQAQEEILNLVAEAQQIVRPHPVAAWNEFLQAQVAEGRKKKIIQGKRGEELFHLILSGIREIYDVEAVIAGGAVRDLAAGVTDSKDVDVFIPITWDKFADGIAELGWQGPVRKAGNGNKAYPIIQGGKKEVGCMFPTLARASSMVQGINVDLVFTAEPLTQDNVATFPVFAQRGVWTLNDGQCLSPEMLSDLNNKTFTIDPTIDNKERLKLVKQKVEGWLKRDGYKDWKMVAPETKEWWEAEEEIKQEPKNKVISSARWFIDYNNGQWEIIDVTEDGKYVIRERVKVDKKPE